MCFKCFVKVLASIVLCAAVHRLSVPPVQYWLVPASVFKHDRCRCVTTLIIQSLKQYATPCKLFPLLKNSMTRRQRLGSRKIAAHAHSGPECGGKTKCRKGSFSRIKWGTCPVST